MIAPASADVRLFTVVNRGPADAPAPLGRAPHPEVATLRGIFEKAGHSVDADQRVGDGPAEILNEIDTWAPDLVVMGRWRARAMERWMGGSVFDRVIRHARVPVFMLTYDPERDGEPVGRDRVAEGERPDGPLRILVPTRGSVWALRASELAARMLPTGTGQVRLLTVLPTELYPLPYTIEGRHASDMPERLTRVAEAAEPAIAEPRAIFQGAGHDVDVHHRFGQPPAEILNEIKDWQPDLVVMGRWRGVSPFEWVPGSVFERIVRHTHVPVLIVK